MRARKSGGIRLVGVIAMAGLVTAASWDEAPVADAAMRGDVEAVRALLADGADVNRPQGDGMTALHWAAEDGAAELARTLLYAGAHTGAVTRNGAYTPLHLAARSAHTEVVGHLMEAGADPDLPSATGATALHFAAAAGGGATVALLLDHGAEVDAREGAAAQTPLMWAAAKDRTEAVRVLLDRGANPDASTTVIDVVARTLEDQEFRARRDRVKEAEWGRDLADSGYADSVRFEQSEPEDLSEEADEAAEAEEDEAAEEEAGAAEPEREDLSFDQLMGKKGGMTALHHAARVGNRATADLLLAAGADIDRTSADLSTPLLVASINGHFDLAVFLLARGADPALASEAGATPLYTTINLQWGPMSWYPQPTAHKQQETSYLQLMEALLEAGADPDVRLDKELWYTEFQGSMLSTNRWGATPFWRAAYGTDVEAMKLLVRYGADPTIRTRREPGGQGYGEELEDYPYPETPVGGPAEAPIHAASGAGYGLGFAGNSHRHAPEGWMPSIRYLVEELGADVNARDHNGYTPLHNAASRGDNEMVRYLVSKGADVKAVSRYGQTTVDMANGPYQRITPFPLTIQLLEGLGAVNNHNCVSC